ncbi:hypothetical protein MOMA_03170 [Moraxella macacae 0408225]|uniref:Type II secretion system protein H n=1 Tax=Moraxella macacae 0408225 TaxID=1230338 RepID=L2F8Y6_9GAMM|nr:prepilin-type N-terminal cleavage/methylation domain-containing protein [Moraxella macacae]ELA09370.1 hypothetical protein MOMA_03170 [Moraxella macacae 0408225]
MPSCIYHRGNYLGFTLIEFIVTIVVMSVLASIAIPTVVDQLKKYESQRVATTISSLLRISKQDAMIYRNTITLCIADEQGKCVANNGTVLLSFIDKNNNHHFDEGVDVIRERAPLKLRYGIVQLRVSLSKTYVNFKASNGNPIGYMGHIRYCPSDNNVQNMFKVSFNKVGIIKVKPYKEEKTGC